MLEFKHPVINIFKPCIWITFLVSHLQVLIFELNQTFQIYHWIVPRFLLRLFDSLLNIRDHQFPFISTPMLTSVFIASLPRVKFHTPFLSKFSLSFTPSKFFLIHWNQSRTFHECSISYLIYSINILATNLDCEFPPCFLVTKLNISIKLSIIIHASNIGPLHVWHLVKQTLQFFYLTLLP